MKRLLPIPWKLTLSFMIGFYSLIANAERVISLEHAITLAQENDPWFQASRLKQHALENRSIASVSLPNPQISIGVMNLPTDTWDFEQESMTQLKIGVSQMFPRGDSLAIKQRQLNIDSTKFPLLREDRKAKLKSKVSELWLDAYLAQTTIELIEKDRVLFEQIADVAKASYSSAVGNTRQHDVIRAQLEIVQLEDRLTVEKQNLETSIARLAEWLRLYDSSTSFSEFDAQAKNIKVSKHLPRLRINHLLALKTSRNQWLKELIHHPALLAIDVKQKVLEKDVDLAKQQYKSQWGVNASYGYRDNTLSNGSDLFSVGVTFDLPMFTKNRQDKQVAASIAESEAIKTEKLLLLRQMVSAVEVEIRQIQRLSERQAIYQDQLLKQTHDQAEASLTAYTNDDGDFAEVVRARITELNTRISALKIDVDVLKAIARINYFLNQPDAEPRYMSSPLPKPQLRGEQ